MQRQRVALARALAVEPRLLLLDEPFGALDAQVHKDLRRWLRNLHDEMGLIGVFITHDQEEADEVVVMNKGRIKQIGTPADIYDNPASPFVYRFLGNVNAVPCPIRGGTAFVRPHDVEILELSPDLPQATIRQVMVLRPLVRVELVLPDGTVLESEVTRESKERPGLHRCLGVSVFLRRTKVFAGDTVSNADLS